MESRLTDAPRMMLLLFAIFSSGLSENSERDFTFCGTWSHGSNALNLNYNLSPGCKGILVSANESSLSVAGQITSRCHKSGVIPLVHPGHGAAGQSHFCLYWEPLLDQMWVKVDRQSHLLCQPAGLQDRCYTHLSDGANMPKGQYGITDGSIRGDVITSETRTAYSFTEDEQCKKEPCEPASQGSTQVNIIEETVRRSQAVGSVVVEMKKDFQDYNVILPAPVGVPPESIPSIHLPSSLKLPARNTSKVVCSFFKNTSLFRDDQAHFTILDEVVGISVENEVIANLLEPIRIGFHHDVINKSHSRKCVSWDTRKAPLKVKWVEDGCVTKQKGAKDTECLCTHLTYFTILVQLEPRPVRYLLALTVITSLGCAVSAISCVALIIFLSKKRRAKEQSLPIHMGLAVSLLFLNVLFFLTGTLANVGGEGLCLWVGVGLHYALLSSFTWMAIEVFQTFWLVYMVFSPSPKPYVWNLIGFLLPAVPVIILVSIGDIYGVREVVQSDDVSSPYMMCWMKDTHKALLAHYVTNMTILAVLVLSGLVMLFLVYRQIRTREEWRQNRMAFLSIWGLSCLFGTTWGLSFLDFGPLADLVLFLSCILNSLQGFFLMLRFYMLGWMGKQAGGSSLGSSSTGSTRQHMLRTQENT